MMSAEIYLKRILDVLTAMQSAPSPLVLENSSPSVSAMNAKGTIEVDEDRTVNRHSKTTITFDIDFSMDYESNEGV